MKLQFVEYLPLCKTMAFEAIYPENLQLDLEEKYALKEAGATFIWLIDRDSKELIGETYYVPLDNIREEMEGTGIDGYFGKNAVYVYSTTILPKFQKQGLGKILKAYLLSQLESKGYDYSLGHARDNGSLALNRFFGAVPIGTQEDWCDTGETVTVYLQEIQSLKEQDKDYNCGAYAADFFVSLYGIQSVLSTADAGCSPENGLSHGYIEALVKEVCFEGQTVYSKDNATVEELAENLPAIVNYQFEGDGHYGVAINIYGEFMDIYNPATGDMEKIKVRGFAEQWYSNRYGPQWFLTIK